ncbi:MAG: Wzz/FepE/Etk N-terminal domain-containing protein [Candidatus Bipolaricaulia bacterium]
MEISLLDILLVLARHKMIIVRTVLVFALVGVTYALLASEEYTSDAKVVREAQAKSGGVSLPSGIPGGALSGLGINLGGAASGLTPAAFPEVLRSREVRLAVVRDTFRFPDAERPMTFVDYVNRPPGILSQVLDYTLWLPWTLKRTLGNAISDSPAPAGTTKTGEPVIPSEAEDKALKVISEMVSTSVNEETGLMTIAVTTQGPRLASDLAQNFVHHLRTRIRAIRTEKVRNKLQFVKQRFQEAEQELEAAEGRLAKFLERNQSLNSPQLQFQRDRLQRQVTFKQQLYSDLQNQLTQARLDVQQRQPVVTVVEKPVPPIQKSGPRRLFIIVISVFVGGVLGIIIVSSKRIIEAQVERGKKEEIEEIRDKLFSVGAWKREVQRKAPFVVEPQNGGRDSRDQKNSH